MSGGDLQVLDPSVMSDDELLKLFRDARERGVVFTMNLNETKQDDNKVVKKRNVELVSSVALRDCDVCLAHGHQDLPLDTITCHQQLSTSFSDVDGISKDAQSDSTIGRNKKKSSTIDCKKNAVVVKNIPSHTEEENDFGTISSKLSEHKPKTEIESVCANTSNMKVSDDYGYKTTKGIPVVKKKCYQCFVCSLQLLSRTAYGIHHYTVHAKGSVTRDEPSFQCSKCKKTLATATTYLDHILLHAGIKDYCCRMCNMLLPSRKHLYRHTVAHHKEQTLSCGICQKKFYFESELRRHVAFHKDLKVHECVHCGLSFVTSYQLNRHRKTHQQKVQEYSCSICCSVFKSKVVLAKHYKTNHESDKRFVCDKCGESYMHRVSLKRHLSTHELKSHKCTLCNKLYHRKSSLQIHMRSHSGEKPFMCEKCGKAFSQKSSLYRHNAKLKSCKLSLLQQSVSSEISMANTAV